MLACLSEQAKEKFARMMSEQREAGVSDEDLKQMITKEGFEKYKKVIAPPARALAVVALVVSPRGRLLTHLFFCVGAAVLRWTHAGVAW